LFALADELGVVVETAAQRVSRLLVHKLAKPVEPSAADYQRVDINRVDAFESRISVLKPLLTMIPVPTGLNQLCAYSLYQSKAHSLHPLYLMALKQCLIELIVGIYIKVECCLYCILIKEIAILCICEFAYYQNIYNYDLPVNGD
jgi:hypothetical protein